MALELNFALSDIDLFILPDASPNGVQNRYPVGLHPNKLVYYMSMHIVISFQYISYIILSDTGIMAWN